MARRRAPTPGNGWPQTPSNLATGSKKRQVPVPDPRQARKAARARNRYGLDSEESRLSGCATTHRIRPAVFPGDTPRQVFASKHLSTDPANVTPGTADPARAQAHPDPMPETPTAPMGNDAPDTTCLPSSPTTRAGQVTTSYTLVATLPTGAPSSAEPDHGGPQRPDQPRDRQQQKRRFRHRVHVRLRSRLGPKRVRPDAGGAGRADVR